MGKQLILLDTEYVAEQLHSLLSEIYNKGTILRAGKRIVKPTIGLTVKITYAILKELIQTRSVFAQEIDPDALETTVDRYIYGLLFNLRNADIKESELDSLNEFIYDRLYLNVSKYLGEQIDQYIKSGNHAIWKVLVIGRTLGLLEDEDYRIKEYYRLTEDPRDESTALNLDLTHVVEFIRYKTKFGQNINLSNVPDDFINWTIQTLILDSITTNLPNVTIETSGVLAMVKVRQSIEQFLSVQSQYSKTVIEQYIWNILETFSFHALRNTLERDKFYTVEFNSNQLSFTLQSLTNKADSSEAYSRNLVMSLLNGDYLPPEERSIAESYYQTHYDTFN